jgi:predicted metal-dependent phosphoesterase TrpH
MKFDLHIHSKYSYDSFLSPENIIKIAKKRGLDGVAVTDHNTIKGGIETSKRNSINDFNVIVGSEIKTEYGDIIGLLLNEEVKSRIFIQVVEEIKNQGGLVILAHPFRKRIDFPIELLKYIELIEAFNARSSRNLNARALEFAGKFNKPMTAGSDAHLGFEIGQAHAHLSGDFRESLYKGDKEIYGKESNYYLVHGLSIGFEKIKKMV